MTEVIHLLDDKPLPRPERPGGASRADRVAQLQADCVLVRRGGTEVPIAGSVAQIWDRAGRANGEVMVFRDASAARAQAEEMSHSARHDFLTGLPNRMFFEDRLTSAIAIAPRHRKKVAVLFIDLDGFKRVNDSLGHSMGDKLLQPVAKRLLECVRGSDTVSRQGGDEFTVLLSEIELPQDAAISTRRMLAAIAEPHIIAEHELSITGSVGISIYPDDDEDGRLLIQNADTAMYRSKEIGRHTYQFFRPAMNLRAQERQTIEGSLRSALARRELAIEYQAKINLKTGAITGAEALLRWTHPVLGTVEPSKFIPKEQIRWIAHSLASAAGTFGFDKVSATAAEFERNIGTSAQFDLARGCQAVVAQIREATANHPAPTLRRHTDLPALADTRQEDLFPAEDPAADRSHDGILVVASPGRYPGLASVVTSLGYTPVDATAKVNAGMLKDGRIAAALICDDVDGVLQIARNYSLQIPVLLLSAAPTFHRQLAATRAGVSGILPEPLDVVELADWLGDLAPWHQQRPFLILIIDGDRLLGEAYALLLQAAGMQTEVLTDGSQALERIAAISPDLVLLDIHLPEINGIDLAKVIRQSRRELSLPIVFVSTETDPHMQLEARIQGSDDFIRKPIDRRTLVSLVTLRARRAMALRSLLERDGLTGLLNYSKFMVRLSHEVERCRRTGGEITLALVDLDNLRRANEQLGYVRADGIIRSLAQALVGRLRRIDVVARYTGR